MWWTLQSMLWSFLPENRSVSFTFVFFVVLMTLCIILFLVGAIRRRRWARRLATVSVMIGAVSWALLFSFRPAWLRIATQDVVPMPTASALHWQSRAQGLETAELTLTVQGEFVDRMVLVRLNPQYYKFSVHWDSSGKRTAEDWQQELDAVVVVNGSYFDADFLPLTPLRTAGISAGPTTYHSNHGAFVVDGTGVDIIDLQSHDVSNAINPFSDAMVSYPFLISPDGKNRAVESKTWLASRNVVGIDTEGRVVLGTTETGFFSLHRFGEFLKEGPLQLRVALNLDGGPLVSQIVKTEGFSRHFHGLAEISDDSDLLRVAWHLFSKTNWTLPIVLVAKPTYK
ncbi:MAG: phosphodiester glycosidase family protein [Gammaproteobacteria bacterium]|nr:phosphodiester glycosidase family protein [Gammaproteobacteria bacterium]